MDLKMRDVYPNVGIVETSTIVQPDEEDLITADDDQKMSEKGVKGTTKKTLFIAFGLLFGLSFILGIAK